MAPAAEHILRFAVAGDDAAFVLVQAVQTGSNALDLRLVATEGAAPYVTEIKHSKISALKAKKAVVPDAEWEAILVAVFSQEPAKDIQVLAQISPDESISLAVRRSVQGYSTRLGTILLTHSPDEELELMEWCSTASLGTAATKETLYTTGIRISELEKTIEALKSQLVELVETRTQDENLMMEKFRNLLNEKKLKIRQQQAVIAEAGSAAVAAAAKEAQSAGVQERESEPEAPEATRGGRGRGRARGRAGRAAQPSRPQKRKAATQKTQDQSDSESDFERMDVDVKKEEETSDADLGAESDATRSTADEATASDSDNDNIPVRQSARLAHKEDDAHDGDGTVDDDGGKTASEDEGEAEEPPPPPRALPFTHRDRAKNVQAVAGPSNDGDATSDDDDEL